MWNRRVSQRDGDEVNGGGLRVSTLVSLVEVNIESFSPTTLAVTGAIALRSGLSFSTCLARVKIDRSRPIICACGARQRVKNVSPFKVCGGSEGRT